MEKALTYGARIIIGLIVIAFIFIAVNKARAYDVKARWQRISAIAGETLAIGDLAAIKDSDGYAYKADADSSILRPAIGVITKGASSGNNVEICVFGVLSGWSGLSEGQPAYLSTSAGAITQSAPGVWDQQIGYAISTSQYLFNFQVDIGEPVSAHTASYTLSTADCGAVHTNEGASGTIILNLPGAAAGLEYKVINIDSNPYTVNINPEDADQIINRTDAAGDSIESNAAGESITLKAIDSTNWVITSVYPAATDWADAN